MVKVVSVVSAEHSVVEPVVASVRVPDVVAIRVSVVESVRVFVLELERVSLVGDSEMVLRLDSVLVGLEGQQFPAAAMPAASKNTKGWAPCEKVIVSDWAMLGGSFPLGAGG